MMKKLILALLLSLLLSLLQIVSFAQEQPFVSAVDGNVSITANVEAIDGTPVLIFILPAITDGDTDITAQKVCEIKTSDMISEMNVEYIGLEYAEAGKVIHNCVMKDSLATGLCHVIFSYLGTESCYSVGTFEHVGEGDKASLLNSINDADKASYETIIDEDINGKFDEDSNTRLTPKEILRKSSADVAYYNNLDENKAEFHDLLYNLKGDDDFDLPRLIKAFNEAGVWMRLRYESDTLSVLSNYNGEGEGKYWNIAIGEESDFATSITDDEKKAILDKIKTSRYEKSSVLEAGFHKEVVMAMFRSVSTREELAALISENGKYAAEFQPVRDIIADATLNEYKTALLYNNILDKNSQCVTMTQIESLFTEAVSESSSANSGGGGGGGGGGTTEKKPLTSGNESMKYKNEITVVPSKPDIRFFPYKDVEKNHWAYSYVRKLHEDGTVNGVSTEAFAPENSIARQDFVKILIGVLNIPKSETESSFSDVESGSYYAPFVMAAFEKGLIKGVGDSVFGTGTLIKREDAAVIMDRVLSLYNADIEENDIEFSDALNISPYAKNSVERVSDAGIFSGDEKGNFNPKECLSRAEACAILCRLAEIIEEV